ncbi:MAG: hypothetical protein ACOZFS_11635 [Thermodesulfobacteriota bacterium]
MRIWTILGEILPIVGTVALLGLWLYQQTEIERRTGELQRLLSARSVFQTYQSNNALFNAINELSGQNQKASEQVRVYQMYNYELGLAAIEEALPASDKADIPPRTEAYDSSVELQKKMEQLQERLGKLQVKLGEREKNIREAASSAKRTYLGIYLGISLVTILGAICKVINTLSAVPK